MSISRRILVAVTMAVFGIGSWGFGVASGGTTGSASLSMSVATDVELGRVHGMYQTNRCCVDPDPGTTNYCVPKFNPNLVVHCDILTTLQYCIGKPIVGPSRHASCWVDNRQGAQCRTPLMWCVSYWRGVCLMVDSTTMAMDCVVDPATGVQLYGGHRLFCSAADGSWLCP